MTGRCARRWLGLTTMALCLSTGPAIATGRAAEWPAGRCSVGDGDVGAAVTWSSSGGRRATRQAKRIAVALGRDPMLAGLRLTLIVSGDTARISGTVRLAVQALRAQTIAGAVEAVAATVDQTQVALVSTDPAALKQLVQGVVDRFFAWRDGRVTATLGADRVVTLTGSVASVGDGWALTEAVAAVEGVRAVRSTALAAVGIAEPGTFLPTLESVLSTHPPRDARGEPKLTLRLDADGTVVLSGWVKSFAHWQSAHDAVASVYGVRRFDAHDLRIRMTLPSSRADLPDGVPVGPEIVPAPHPTVAAPVRGRN